MKTLFFVLGLLLSCKPSKVKITETDEPISTEETAVEEVYLEPVGVIPADDCQQIDIGDKACNFRLADQNADTWDLYSHSGNLIILDFSTVWCYPCQMAGYYAQSIQDDYSDDGVQFVTILIDGATSGVEPTESEIDAWVSDHGITSAPILQGSRTKMLDPAGVGIEGYLLGAFPTYIYIGRDMKFIGGHVGFSDEYVRQQIEENL